MNSNKGRSRKKRTPYAKKILLAAVMAMLLGIAAVGTSLAFLVDQTSKITNQFVPSTVTGEIEENFDGQIKEDVAIRNNGDIPAYIRVTVVPNWVDKDGNIAAEVEGDDYVIEWNLSPTSQWIKCADGFYYHTSPVEPSNATDILITSCKPLVSKTDASGNPLHFELHVIASLIQAEPSNAVKDAWKVTIDENGNITNQ